MRHASWFAHLVYEKVCLIWVDVSFVHSSHLIHQFGGKLTHQSKLYVSDSTNLFKHFTHDAPRICTTHRVDPALVIEEHVHYMTMCAIKIFTHIQQDELHVCWHGVHVQWDKVHMRLDWVYMQRDKGCVWLDKSLYATGYSSYKRIEFMWEKFQFVCGEMELLCMG